MGGNVEEKALASVESLSSLKKGVCCPVLFAPRRKNYSGLTPLINFECILNHLSAGTKEYIIPFPSLDYAPQIELLGKPNEEFYEKNNNIAEILYESYDNRGLSFVFKSTISLFKFITSPYTVASGNQFNYFYKYVRYHISNTKSSDATKFTKFKEFFGVQVELNRPQGRIEIFDICPKVEITCGNDLDIDIQNKSKIDSFTLHISESTVKNIKYDFKKENENPDSASVRKLNLHDSTILNDLNLTNFDTYFLNENTYKRNSSITITRADAVCIEVADEKLDLSKIKMNGVRYVELRGKKFSSSSVVSSIPLKVDETFSIRRCSVILDELHIGNGIKTVLNPRVEETYLSIKKCYLHMAPEGYFALQTFGSITTIGGANSNINIDELIIDCPVETEPVLKFLVDVRDIPSQIQIGKITTVNNNPTITIIPLKNLLTINNILVSRKRTFKQGQLNGK